MSALSTQKKPGSELVTIQVWKHSCRCGNDWTSEIPEPKFCPRCKDPRWRLPRKFWKTSKKKNKRFWAKREDEEPERSKDASRYSYPEAARAKAEEQEERRREMVIRDMYRGQSKGMNPTTAIFNRDEVAMTLSFRNNKGASGP